MPDSPDPAEQPDAPGAPGADSPHSRPGSTPAAGHAALSGTPTPGDAGEHHSRRTIHRLMQVIRWSAAILLGSGVLTLVVGLTYQLRVVVIPVLVALLITALIVPLDRLLRRVGLRRGWAAGVSAVLLIAVIAAVVRVMVQLLTDAAADLSTTLRDLVDRASEESGPVADAVRGAADSLSSLGSAAAGAAAQGAFTGISLAGQLVAGTVLTLTLVFFVLRDRERMVDAVRRWTPGGRGELAVRLGRRAWDSMAGFMRGTTIIAAIDAVFITVGLALLGVPQAAALGALVFVGAYIPFVGAFLSGTVAVLVALADQGIMLAVGALAVVLAVQLIEGTLLQPLVHSRTVFLHPAFVLLAVAAGASLGGLIGTLLAVPLTAAAVGVVSELRDHWSRRTPDGGGRRSDSATGAGGAGGAASPVA
ncbi:AI-2E family transporter [Streptomyces spiramenti]|uniref:AI-2E family transporter n=1 Tax=Streptomyces spiramenti TaxID=2720606 RepID=A0ABX1ARJ0_9ACTN|nr:AI-2E family transporter [Streptomyces spiramenti]NJP68434.1 AI-2E family transporter [Streptomyces spiramenti]